MYSEFQNLSNLSNQEINAIRRSFSVQNKDLCTLGVNFDIIIT